ncbi:MAG: transposase family protein [Candidatus Binataceae bacterium]
MSDGSSRTLPVAPVESATAVIDEGAMPSNVAGVAGMSDQAGQYEIDAHIAKYQSAGPKERAKGERIAAAFESNREQSKRHGEMGAFIRRVAAIAELRESQTRALWKKLQRFELGLWGAVCTPCRTKRKSFVDSRPEIAAAATGHILERRDHISDANVWRLVQIQFGLEDRQQEAVERWCRKFRKQNRAKITIAVNPDRARSLYLPAHGRSDEGVTEFLEEGQLDGSPSDTFTISTRSGRMRLLVLIDTLTRLPVVIVAPSESGEAAGRLIIKANRILGMFRRIKTDHGSGFKSERMRISLARAGVEFLELALPYSGHLKPIVESFIRELQRFLELTLGFGGHNVSQRQALRGHRSMADRRGRSDVELLGAT